MVWCSILLRNLDGILVADSLPEARGGGGDTVCCRSVVPPEVTLLFSPAPLELSPSRVFGLDAAGDWTTLDLLDCWMVEEVLLLLPLAKDDSIRLVALLTLSLAFDLKLMSTTDFDFVVDARRS